MSVWWFYCVLGWDFEQERRESRDFSVFVCVKWECKFQIKGLKVIDKCWCVRMDKWWFSLDCIGLKGGWERRPVLAWYIYKKSFYLLNLLFHAKNGQPSSSPPPLKPMKSHAKTIILPILTLQHFPITFYPFIWNLHSHFTHTNTLKSLPSLLSYSKSQPRTQRKSLNTHSKINL